MSPPSPPGRAPARRHIAAGDFVSRVPGSDPPALLIDTRIERPHWRARSESTFGHPPLPGTALLFDGAPWEVVEIGWREGSFPRYTYRLEPWDERHPLRQPETYSAEEVRRLVEQRRAAARSNRASVGARLLSPLLGALPADLQLRIANDAGFPPGQLTLPSAVLETLVGIAMTGRLVYGLVGLDAYGSPGVWYQDSTAGPFFVIEGAVRTLMALRVGAASGALPVALPVEIVRRVGRFLRPRRTPAAATSARDFHRVGLDEVLEVFGQAHDLEVTSVLPKPHWLPKTGIRFREGWYFLVDAQQVRDRHAPRHRFLLRKAKDGEGFAATAAYSPDEVRRLWREERRRADGARVRLLSPLLGLADEDDQRRLAEIHDLDPARASATSAVATLAAAGAFVLFAGTEWTQGRGSAPLLAGLLLAGPLAIEGAVRFALAAAGRASGSLLSSFVRPLVDRLLG